MTTFRSFFLFSRHAACVALAAALLASSPARAEGVVGTLLTAGDKARLAALDTSRDEAVARARAQGDPAAVRVLDDVLAGQLQSVRDGFAPLGAWRCRTIKLGREVPITVYGWFNCRIVEDGVGYRLEKLTGSQRTAGYLYDDTDTALIYLGALSYAGEPLGRYGANAERNMPGRLVRTAPGAMRIEFPKPVHESDFDILELRRD
jgi:hypothetical protein